MQTSHPEADDRAGDESRFKEFLARFHPQRGFDWLGDTGRLWWGFASLNTRKTLFRMRKGRGRCPCQNPSDSGKAWETSCDAVLNWNSPVRFRRLCPLLGKAPDGSWRCTVNTADVRPFWGRAILCFAGTGGVVYLAATLGAFGLLRAVGYPVRYRAVAWPRSWHEIREARAHYFFAKARVALKGNRPVEALMSLSQSYELDPSNYSAGRILAELWESGGSDNSSLLFRKLMIDHPAERQETAQAWLRALLTHGDFASIEALARERISADTANRDVWLHALLFAVRQTGNPQALEPILQNSSLPPYVRQVCAWESKLATGTKEEARTLLTGNIAPDSEQFLIYYRIWRLNQAGLASEGWLQLLRYGNRLSSYDRERLLLECEADQDWSGFLDGEFQKLLRGDIAAPVVTLLSTHLIRHPNKARLVLLADAVRAHPLPLDSKEVSTYASLFCAAGACQDGPRMQEYAEILKNITGARLGMLDSVQAYFRGEMRDVPLERLMPALSVLPIEVSYALFDFAARRRNEQKAAKSDANPTSTSP